MIAGTEFIRPKHQRLIFGGVELSPADVTLGSVGVRFSEGKV